MSDLIDWVEEFPGFISVCDTEGIIVAMNRKIADYFASTGGKSLIGSSIFDCHSAESTRQIREQLESRKMIVYTHDADGQQELVLHVPWYREGEFAGLVEIALPLESEIRNL